MLINLMTFAHLALSPVLLVCTAIEAQTLHKSGRLAACSTLCALTQVASDCSSSGHDWTGLVKTYSHCH